MTTFGQHPTLGQTHLGGEPAQERAPLPVLKMKTNMSYTVRLNFDTPKTGEGQHGPWHMYNVHVVECPEGAVGKFKDGRTIPITKTDVIIFASKGLHEELSQYHKDDIVTIIKEEVDGERGSYTRFRVELVSRQDPHRRIAPDFLSAHQQQIWDKLQYDITPMFHDAMIEALRYDGNLDLQQFTEGMKQIHPDLGQEGVAKLYAQYCAFHQQ